MCRDYARLSDDGYCAETGPHEESMSEAPISDDRPKTSTRDHAVLRAQLTEWLRTKLDDAEITDFTIPGTTGMSSETVLFDARWTDGYGTSKTDRFVLRLPPDPRS